MSTNAARFRMAAGPDATLLEFGLRRAQGPDGGMSASKCVAMTQWLLPPAVLKVVPCVFIEQICRAGRLRWHQQCASRHDV